MRTFNCQRATPEIPRLIAAVDGTRIRRRTSGLLLALFLMATCASSVPAKAVLRCCAGPQSETSLKASEKSITQGTKITLTATVAPSKATGDVTFYLGKKEIGKSAVIAGVAKLKTTSLPVGKDEITAIYSGSKKYLGSKSKAVTIEVKSDGSCNCRLH
jgi:Bacterial Ig-like domain (group 3)